MAGSSLVYADLRLTHGNELVRVTGGGDRIEVSHRSLRFLLRALRQSYLFKYKHFLAVDQALRELGVSVVVKTNYASITVLGVNAKQWVRSVLGYLLPA
jgi:hypothetical protein